MDTTQFSTTDEKPENESIAKSDLAKQIDEIVKEGQQAASHLVDNFNDVSSTPINGDDLFTTTLMLIEKSKAEGYRTLARVAALASKHVSIKHLKLNVF